jgi:hypothetical protein
MPRVSFKRSGSKTWWGGEPACVGASRICYTVNMEIVLDYGRIVDFVHFMNRRFSDADL